ncbi:MAG: hypothetical protein DRP64_11920, partial [Verrucomicrobia bacterium]
MKNYDKLIIFTRFPEPGKTKTRLIPHLGAEGAAQLQKEMTEHAVKQAHRSGARIEIRYTGGSLAQMRDWLGADLAYAEQGGGDLGERMERAFSKHFKEGVQRIVIIGSDCPSNDWENMEEAFHALKTNECVIGPASDGGYYLIGLCRAGALSPLPRSRPSATFPSELFQGIDWRGEHVFEQTMKAASELTVAELKQLDDVDRPEDIPSKISVIIPTLNEELHLFQAIGRAREGFNVEVIVADGGSRDRTLEKTVGACVIECNQGRAAQQNEGAKASTGDILLFLHADTILPDGWDWVVRETLRDSTIALGAFTFRIKEKIRGLKFIEDIANWRSKRGGLPYGDQGLFMRKKTFEQVGGFPDMPIMEDYALVRALRRFGEVVTVPAAAVTSG